MNVKESKVRKVKKLHTEGEDIEDIAQIVGYTSSTVKRLLNANGDDNDSSQVGPEEFIRIWQNAKGVDEVVAKTGLSRTAAIARAASYRDKDVPLKKMQRGRSYDWDKLSEFAEMQLA